MTSLCCPCSAGDDKAARTVLRPQWVLPSPAQQTHSSPPEPLVFALWQADAGQAEHIAAWWRFLNGI